MEKSAQKIRLCRVLLLHDLRCGLKNIRQFRKSLTPPQRRESSGFSLMPILLKDGSQCDNREVPAPLRIPRDTVHTKQKAYDPFKPLAPVHRFHSLTVAPRQPLNSPIKLELKKQTTQHSDPDTHQRRDNIFEESNVFYFNKKMQNLIRNRSKIWMKHFYDGLCAKIKRGNLGFVAAKIVAARMLIVYRQLLDAAKTSQVFSMPSSPSFGIKRESSSASFGFSVVRNLPSCEYLYPLNVLKPEQVEEVNFQENPGKLSRQTLVGPRRSVPVEGVLTQFSSSRVRGIVITVDEIFTSNGKKIDSVAKLDTPGQHLDDSGGSNSRDDLKSIAKRIRSASKKTQKKTKRRKKQKSLAVTTLFRRVGEAVKRQLLNSFLKIRYTKNENPPRTPRETKEPKVLYPKVVQLKPTVYSLGNVSGGRTSYLRKSVVPSQKRGNCGLKSENLHVFWTGSIRRAFSTSLRFDYK